MHTYTNVLYIDFLLVGNYLGLFPVMTMWSIIVRLAALIGEKVDYDSHRLFFPVDP